MSLHPQPRRVRLDGTDAVVLTPDAYDRLDNIRRQAGAQANRIHALREQLAAATALLEAIRQAAGQAGCAHNTGEHVPVCLRESVLAILGSDAAVNSRRPRRPDPGSGPDPDQTS